MEKQIEQLYKPLFLYVRKRINNQLDAEDLTQEIFYKLSTSKNENVKNIKSWVYTIAKNSITDYYRKKKRFTEDIEVIEFQKELSEKNTVNELSNCIAPFVNQLPENYRTIINLSEIENFSQKEIAEKLNLNYTTVRSKIQRGRVKLKKLISDCCTITQGGKGAIMDYKKNKKCGDNCAN
ncbi:sigma-70 family RNA polymerase sigma factor [Wocania ichthyoenteri]|uniref:sigma-70 family RNA polymerase sigma factor n=1 Tax=Wocania ichthyoenteri TaxID=1230531 RepID=UPI00053E693A|nr:sigma-70 family RNA polymerase sigma factor [Wocania ichthyoenteri]